jgi:fructokinase
MCEPNDLGRPSDVAPSRILALGEVLWDVFEDSVRLGGAPLNFCANARRMGHEALLVSAIGTDELGDRTLAALTELGLETRWIQRASDCGTGTARVELGPDRQPHFTIPRPAAYDCVRISDDEIQMLREWSPTWLYYGTLFSSRAEGKAALEKLFEALPNWSRFYDLNLRPESDSPALVAQLLSAADVVKMNENECELVRGLGGLPRDLEAFCREGSKHYGWQAVCVTSGARGCAIFCRDEYVQAAGQNIELADPVGAGDAFAAAFLHGLISKWPVTKVAAFSNAIGALVASRRGAIPDWTLEEVQL